jgi:hypothetical protein
MRIVCTACKGKGERIVVNVGLAICTLGIGALVDAMLPDRCKVCDGRGWLAVGACRDARPRCG